MTLQYGTVRHTEWLSPSMIRVPKGPRKPKDPNPQ